MATSMYAATQEFFRVEKQVIVAALYVRNSDSSKMDTEVQKAQLEALRTYAKAHGYEVREHWVFKEAISAIKHPYWERKELLRLWDEAERGSFDVVLVTEMFRLARFASEQFAIIEHLKRYNVRVESTTEKFEDTAEGRLLMSIQGFLGEVEANKIAIRTSRGRFHRAKQALSGQGQPAYGFVWGNTKEYNNAYYVKSTRTFGDKSGAEWTELKVVDWTYEHCLAGMSLRQMALSLTRLGVPTREGKPVWTVATLHKILTDRKYTGRALTRSEDGEEVEITGLIPRIVSDETFARVQVQLALNAELSPRNNKYPKDTIMRGQVFCGVCGRKMHIKHYLDHHGEQLQRHVYKCTRNEGIDEARYKHTISVTCGNLDEEAWQFAILYIRNPKLLQEHIHSLQERIPETNHAESIAESLGKLDKALQNLYKLAEVALDTTELEERLVDLQLKKRDLERLYLAATNTAQKQEDLRVALDRFHAWAAAQREFLDDPGYAVTHEDKLAAILFLGVKATVFPVDGLKKRVKLELMPPDIDRLLRLFCRG
jgi:site-specific DNA recombinase